MIPSTALVMCPDPLARRMRRLCGHCHASRWFCNSHPVRWTLLTTAGASTMSNSGVLDTRFRSALGRMAEHGRLTAYTAPVDPHLEVAAIMKQLNGGPALLFTAGDGYDTP